MSESGVDEAAFVADLNDKIRSRGFVLWDGQVLTTPISQSVELYFEGAEPFDVPVRREWGASQRAYFGLADPYQMADEEDQFTCSHIMTQLMDAYLAEGELIAALLHGAQDRSYFYCPCHFASVVYTTGHRLVCMACGATHAVLRAPLPLTATTLLTAAEWADLFDEDGARRDEEVELTTIDFRDVENAETIWTTNQWEEAAGDFVFFARSSPEEIEEATRGEADASVLLEAGFKPVATAPPPALQVSPSSVNVDLTENAGHALREGVASFLAARDLPHALLTAIPQLHRAIELLLKARLERFDSEALRDRPNNPTVLDRLRQRGLTLAATDLSTITRLRGLRNDLQHGTSHFNQRAGLALCRSAVVFVDQFADSELDLWIADAVSVDDWPKLLSIPEIARTAERIAHQRLEVFRDRPEAEITTCPRCTKDSLFRRDASSGAACAYCGYVPRYSDDD